MSPEWAGPVLLAGVLAAMPCRAAESLPAGFVYLDSVAPGIDQDIRYAGPDNFIGRPLRGYLAPRCILTRPAARALQRAAARLAKRGFGLRVLDCYRPVRAVEDIAAWSQDRKPAATRAYYFAGYSKPGLFRAGYIARRSGHSRGSTVDITLLRTVQETKPSPSGPPRSKDGTIRAPRCDARQPAGRLRRERELDMGTDFDCFSPLSATASTRVSRQARKNRRILLRTLQRQGFQNFSGEWWHFRLKREPYPNRYFDFPVR